MWFLTIILWNRDTLPVVAHILFCIFGDLCLSAFFDLDFACASAITNKTIGAAYARSVIVACDTLVPRTNYCVVSL